MAEYQEKTEQATPRRRQKSREKGEVARSQELTSLLTVGAIILVVYLTGSDFIRNISELTTRLLRFQYGYDIPAVMRTASVEALFMLMPFFAISVAFALISGVTQGGIVLKPIKMEFDKVNPINGFKRMFSKEKLVELAKTLFKFIVGALVCYFIISAAIPIIPSIIAFDVASIRDIAYSLVAKAVVITFLTFLAVAILDYLFERWRFERSIKMSKEELKEEHKETEGDPLIRSRIKSIQREIARRRMMQEVPKATVVITNPIHLAIALQYKRAEMEAPKVIAKGAGIIAEKIKETAAKHSIPIIEDPSLARALFKLKIDSYIPEELYKAVARILAYIYKMKGAA
jgi:flagellar biosynthetic protein FlhB